MTSHDDSLDEVPDVPDPELLKPATTETRSSTMVYFDRLKKSVVMRNAKELGQDAFENERLLAYLAKQYGDDIVTCSVDEAVTRVRAVRLANYKRAMTELMNARHLRADYTGRLF